MSDLVQDVTMVHRFQHPLASSLRKNDNELMARLNYLTSRICAALSQFMALSPEAEDAALWWWTGLQKELVTCKILWFGED